VAWALALGQRLVLEWVLEWAWAKEQVWELEAAVCRIPCTDPNRNCQDRKNAPDNKLSLQSWHLWDGRMSRPSKAALQS
jgi:hypothetical protein